MRAALADRRRRERAARENKYRELGSFFFSLTNRDSEEHKRSKEMPVGSATLSKYKQYKSHSHVVRAVFQVRVSRWRSNTDLFAKLSWASARCDEMDLRLFQATARWLIRGWSFGPSNPYALVRKVISKTEPV
jgi:hypothetical protein